MDSDKNVLFTDYERHFANIQDTLLKLLKKAFEEHGDLNVHPMITGSGGLTLANHLNVPFTQEVIAVSTALTEMTTGCDVAIELGGEDAKIIYFEGGTVEQSYNSLYTIAARCGVFAKSDIQPLINDGATKEDLSASIFQAVVNQTISGLACGKPIRGRVAFLGGPLHFLSELKAAFIRTLKLDDEHVVDTGRSHLYAAMGSALNAKEDVSVNLSEMIEMLQKGIKMDFEVARMEPLFKDEADYEEFKARHEKACVKKGSLSSYHGNILFIQTTTALLFRRP